MTESKPPMKSKWSKVVKTGLVFLVVFTCILAFVYSKTDIIPAARSYEANRKAAEEAGMFLSAEQISGAFRVPEKDNGATLVLEAAAILDKLKLSNDRRITEGTLNTHRADFQTIVQKLDEASRRKRLLFPYDINDPKASTYGDLILAKRLVILLTQMVSFATSGHDAQKLLNMAAYLSNGIDDEKTHLANIMRTGSALSIDRCLRTALEKHGRDPAWQRAIESTLQRLDEPYDPASVLKVEHWRTIQSADLLVKDPRQFFMVPNFSGASVTTAYGPVPREIQYGRFLPGFRQANLSRVHEGFAKAAKELPNDPSDIAGSATAYKTLDAFGRRGEVLSYTFVDVASGPFSLGIGFIPDEIAARNVLLQTVTLLKTGADPAKGLPVKGRHALDVDGKPIRVKKASKGWIVYSVGEDRVDDGGHEFTNRKSDWVVHLPK